MKKAMAITLILTFSSTAFAEADLNPSIFKPKSTTASPPAPTAGVKDKPVAPINPVQSKIAPIRGSINPAALEGQQAQGAASGANAQVGNALMTTGARLMAHKETRPRGAVLMAMGVLAMMQSAHDSGAAGASGLTSDFSNTGGGGIGTNPASNSGNGGTGGFANDKVKEGIAALKEAGYKMNEKGLTNPDGSFVPANAFDSPSAMAAAGIDAGAISESQRTLEAALAGAHGASGGSDSAKVSSVDLNIDAAGGGGGGDNAYQGDAGGEEGLTGLPNPFALNSEKKAALVAGKTVNFDGEPIGVSGQNIFYMVHSRYQKKRARNNFIETEHIVINRMPASAKPRSK